MHIPPFRQGLEEHASISVKTKSIPWSMFYLLLLCWWWRIKLAAKIPIFKRHSDFAQKRFLNQIWLIIDHKYIYIAEIKFGQINFIPVWYFSEGSAPSNSNSF